MNAIRDQLLEGAAAKVTTQGDTVFASGANALSRLAIGSAYQGLRVNAAGTAPEWGSTARCRVFRGSALTISNASTTSVTWANESYDTDGWHDNATNSERVTVDRTGLFLLNAQIAWASNSAGRRELTIRHSVGSTTVARSVKGADALWGNTDGVTTVLQMTAGEYVEVRIYQNSGGNLDINGNGADCYFEVIYLGP